MGLFWTESFEGGYPGAKANANGTQIVSWGRTLGSARTGSYRGNSVYSLLLGAGDQDDLVIVGAAFQTPPSGSDVTSEFDLLMFYGDARATRHVTVTIDRAGGELSPATIKVYRGDKTTGTLLGSAVITEPPAGTYVHMECKVRLHDSTGSVIVRLDEVTILTLTGADTKNGGAAGVFDGIDVSVNYAAGIDDIYVSNEQGSVNTDFQGAKRVELVIPTGNGTTSNGVGSDGNSTDNYNLVDDGSSFNGTDYVDLAATGDKDTYVHSDSALPTGNAVAGVFVWVVAQKTDAGSRSIIPVARLSGTESDGAALPLINGTFTAHGDVFETKPGGGAWTVADVNNAEFGAKAGA